MTSFTSLFSTDPQAALAAAITIAAEEHQGQTDKGGTAYILHPLALMNMVAPDLDLMILAVLHDVLEDTDKRGMEHLRLRDRIWATVGDDLFSDLEALTRRDGETYDQYIGRVAQRYRTRRIKIADLSHNMDPRRIPAGQIVDKDFARWDKYRRALIRLDRED